VKITVTKAEVLLLGFTGLNLKLNLITLTRTKLKFNWWL